jgi:hypothetical protein
VCCRTDQASSDLYDARLEWETSIVKDKIIATPSELVETSRSSADAEMLLREAHRVLAHYLPGTPLPDEISRVRIMLDAHMFGRDKRASRDDVVEVARLIDRVRPRPPTSERARPFHR